MRVSGSDASTPASAAKSLPLDVRRARALPGAAHAIRQDRSFDGGRAERILAPSFGVARMLELYRANESPYTPPRVSNFHVFV